MAIPGLNQWHLAGALLNLPNNMMERMSSIAIRVSFAAAAAQVGLRLAKMGISQVCPKGACDARDIDAFMDAIEVCDKEWPQKALVDPENPPFGWEVDPSKREIALVDPANPPLDWKNGSYAECVKTSICKSPISFCKSIQSICGLPAETKFCKSIHSMENIVEGIVSPISKKVNSIVGNVYFLPPVVMGLLWTFNRIAHRGP